MARAFLLIFGLGTFAWGATAVFATDFMLARMGLTAVDADGLIEFYAINAGMWPAIAIFAWLGALIPRLRIAAILMILVGMAGMVAGRIIAFLQGVEPGLYTYAALGLEITTLLLAAIAFGSEKTRVRREAKLAEAAQAAAQLPPIEARPSHRSEAIPATRL